MVGVRRVVVFEMQQLAQLASTSAATLSFSPQHRVRAPVAHSCLLRPSRQPGRFHISHRPRYWPIIAGLKRVQGAVSACQPLWETVLFSLVE